ncbi:patatin-like phospholipase family protein [Breznakiella homolactica]|uniref:Patatin family protein n=1 Tax=Breznakiella homolactica TaxID=2798577 RepID=A0A7T8BAV4_9SPIR|nr:patatin family protein [Breznakiella homolactica]QQO09887.1 patatin family protein [Breznakiella homolactica]
MVNNYVPPEHVKPRLISKGLVLEGGGLRGYYTAGLLDGFMEQGIDFPYIIGVSAGVGMGCSYVSRQRERNLDILVNYREDPRYLSFRSYFRTGNLFGLDFIYGDIPHQYVPFDFKTFGASPSRFITVCTDCNTGEAVYYEKDEDILTVMKASAAIPYISKMVEYKGTKLLDGAIADAIPLARAIEDGYRDTVVVLTQPKGYRKKDELHPPAGLFYRRYPRLADVLNKRVAAYNAALDLVEAEEAAGRALVIRPSSDLGVTRMEKSVKKLRDLYELGLHDSKKTGAKL